MIDTSAKTAPNVYCAYLSDATVAECVPLIGKVIASIDAQEYSFILTFTDGSTLETSGNTYDGCAMHVEVTTPVEPIAATVNHIDGDINNNELSNLELKPAKAAGTTMDFINPTIADRD